jgi:lipopolysaccharide biosynthesis regulator YciM
MEFEKDETVTESVNVTIEVGASPHTAAVCATEKEISCEMSRELLERLLTLAQRHRKEGNIQRAKELFWTLVEERSGTPQADTARAELAELAEGLASAAASQPLLEHLFAMAQRYRKEGSLRQATEMYWTLVSDHADTPQAKAAKAELLALADGYERAGNQHMARSMYERLMDLED